MEPEAQMQTIPRMRPCSIYDLALEVAAVRPGVGCNDGVADFLRRCGGYRLGSRSSAEAGGFRAQPGGDHAP